MGKQSTDFDPNRGDFDAELVIFSQNKNSCKLLTYRSLLSDPVGIQTQDLQNRNLTLYSAKLRGLILNSIFTKTTAKVRFLIDN